MFDINQGCGWVYRIPPHHICQQTYTWLHQGYISINLVRKQIRDFFNKKKKIDEPNASKWTRMGAVNK